MRIVAAISLVDQEVTRLLAGGLTGSSAPALVAAGVGLLLLVGLWTPAAGALVAILELWNAFANSGDPWTHILLGSIGAALALLGPGAYSVDARVFGWRRIDIRDRQS